MRAGQTLRWLFWAALYCLLCQRSSARSEEELMDFDFTDLKEIDWNYDSDNEHEPQVHKVLPAGGLGPGAKSSSSSLPPATSQTSLSSDEAFSFDDDDYVEENQVRPYDWREHVLRTALSKALTNGALRQKFVEVMPILRVLTPTQRLALSALISAQINARQGQQLKLDQVRMMFGDDKKLLIPIVYDIANLVRSSARNYLHFDADILPASKLQQKSPPSPSFGRRTIELTDEEAVAEGHIGTVAVGAGGDVDSLEDFFADMPDDILDPQSINEALQAGTPTTPTSKPAASSADPNTPPAAAGRRTRRSVTANTAANKAANTAGAMVMAQATEFVHKLRHVVPLSVNEEDLLKGAAGRTVMLNTTAFLVPNDAARPAATQVPSADATDDHAYRLIEDLAFASLNGSAISLSGDDSSDGDGNNAAGEMNVALVATAVGEDEPLPSPEELIAGPRYRVGGSGKVNMMRSKVAAKRKRVQVRTRLNKGPAPSAAVSSKKCERFTASMCIRTDDYPLDQIMGSIRRHKNAMSALLAEYYDQPHTAPIYADDFDDFGFAKKRREDDVAGGAGASTASGNGMCQSIVRYARPQKARSAAGEWKYIVNTGQHKQTLRLEKCSNPQESCSYLAQSYRSHCSQVYNYHRLLSWDKSRGLHVDIFKVPTCCSCQVDGYRQQFPPLGSAGSGGNVKSKEYTPADVYSTINEELDYNDEDDVADDDELSYQYSDSGGGGYGAHGRHHHEDGYDGNELLLGTKKVRTRVYQPQTAVRPTVGSYLSPPDHRHYSHELQQQQQQQHHGHSHNGHAHNEYETRYAPAHGHGSSHGHGRPLSSSASPFATSSPSGHRRRPYKSLGGGGVFNEARVDLEIAPSETHAEQEVNLFGAPPGVVDKARASQKRKRIYSVPHLPHHTAAASGGGGGATFSIGSNSGNGAGGSGFAAHAHQTPAAIPTYYTSNNNNNKNTNNNGASAGLGFGKSKTRFYATATTSAAAPPATEPVRPPSIHHQSISSFSSPAPSSHSTTTTTTTAATSSGTQESAPPLYHLNSIYGVKHNATTGPAPVAGLGFGHGTKRINYSYHPIIDFFENHSNRRSTSVTSSDSSPSPNAESAGGYQSHERRIGIGAGGGGGGGGGVGIGDNAWHPMISDA